MTGLNYDVNVAMHPSASPHPDSDDWDDVMQTNLRTVFLCSREAAKLIHVAGRLLILLHRVHL